MSPVDDAVSIPCAKCGAKPGEWCTVQIGRVVRRGADRVRLDESTGKAL